MPRLTLCGLTALILFMGTGSASATTLYKWVDEQGVVHYSDTPQPGAQQIEVHTAQTYHAPPTPRAGMAVPPASAAAQAASSYSCRITDPTAEQSFFAPEVVPIAVSLSPALQPGDQVVVTVDGAMLPTSSTLEFQVTQPERGSHTINATVRNGEGKTVCTAPAVTFSVQRPSLLSPASPARGH
jgi:hypothetical protein